MSEDEQDGTSRGGEVRIGEREHGGREPDATRSDGSGSGSARPLGAAPEAGANAPDEAAAVARATPLRLRREADTARDAAEAARTDADRASAEADQAEEAAAEAAEAAERDPILDHETRKREAGVDEENPFGRLGRPMSRRSPFRMGFSAAIGVGLAYLLYRALINAQSVLVLVLVAAFLAIGLHPMVSRLEQLGMRRGFAVGLVFLGVVLFFVIFGYAVLPPVVEQATKFTDAVPGYVKDLQENRQVADLDRRFHLISKLEAYVNSGDLGKRAASNLLSIGSTIAGIVFKALTILILTLYFLSSFNALTHTAYRLVPRSRRARVTLLGDEILSRVGGYVAGAFIVALIAGTSSLVWLSILKVPYPLALALLVTITDIIPLVGATIGAVVVTTVTFFVSLPVGIATGIFFLVYQQVENYAIYPRVMKRSVDVNPAAAIVGALVGATLLGIVGALIAVPATAAIQLILREVVLPRQDAT